MTQAKLPLAGSRLFLFTWGVLEHVVSHSLFSQLCLFRAGVDCGTGVFPVCAAPCVHPHHWHLCGRTLRGSHGNDGGRHLPGVRPRLPGIHAVHIRLCGGCCGLHSAVWLPCSVSNAGGHASHHFHRLWSGRATGEGTSQCGTHWADSCRRCRYQYRIEAKHHPAHAHCNRSRLSGGSGRCSITFAKPRCACPNQDPQEDHNCSKPF